MLSMYRQFTALRLEVCIHPRSVREFATEYARITCEDAVGVDGFNVRNTRWGANPRIYFDGPEVAHNLAMLGFPVTKDRDTRGYLTGQYDYRISSTTLFWKLIRAGYRLGDNVIPALEKVA